MNYLGIVERLISATTDQENLISLNFAREGLSELLLENGCPIYSLARSSLPLSVT